MPPMRQRRLADEGERVQTETSTDFIFQNTLCSRFLLFFIAELLYISMNLSIVDGLKKLHRLAFYVFAYSEFFNLLHNLTSCSNKIAFNIRSQFIIMIIIKTNMYINYS